MAGKAIDSSASGCLVLILPMAFLLAILFLAWPVLLALIVAGIGWRVWQSYQWQKWSQQVNPFFHKLIQENQGAITAMDLVMKANLSGTAAQRYLDAKAEEFGAQRQDYEGKGTVYYFITSSTLGSIFDNSDPSSLYEQDNAPRTPFLESKQVATTNLQTLVAETEVSSLDEINEVVESEEVTSNEALESEAEEVTTSTVDDSELSNQYEIQDSEELSVSNLQKIFDESEPPDIYQSETSTVDASALIESTTEQKQEQPTAEKQTVNQGLIQSELAKRLDVHSSTILKRRSESYFSEWSQSRDPEGIAWKYSRKSKLFYPLTVDS